MQEEPAGCPLVEVDNVQDQHAGEDEPHNGREEAGQMEGEQPVLKVGDKDSEAREEESHDEEKEGEVVDGEGHVDLVLPCANYRSRCLVRKAWRVQRRAVLC